MDDFEKLGAFYLGRRHDLESVCSTSDWFLYDAKVMTTHAVCVGMTGSGKTGLCLSLLEEAAIDRVPAIAIDPKGDLGNLLLAFPELRPEDFRPWIDESEAERSGISPDQFAAQTAERWREGLAQSGQDGARIERFRTAADVAIYTPGSSAGLPLSVLRSFDAPPPAVRSDADALRERVFATVSGLLALLGIDADPIRSREHILLSNLLDRAWREGRSLSVASLIREIQKPPLEKIGIMDLEAVFPAADRVGLSMAMNNLIASPSFAAWMEGEPLDVKRLLYTPQGKPRLSIISIAHLAQSERMFLVTILLNEIVAWMRGQPGTSSLRALVYMDEVFGYFPPIANPPSKTPMLTLLKQARAYGLGIVLATQNPVDLDYKGLSNAGTWLLGRLQTERDMARVLDGLQGAVAASGKQLDRQAMQATLAGLGNRLFLMNNVHEKEPVVFRTRWALSYLRGPLTRVQIQRLTAARRAAATAATSTPTERAPHDLKATKPIDQPASPAAPDAASGSVGQPAGSTERPFVPPEASECFLPVASAAHVRARLVYRPGLLGVVRLHFVRATYHVDQWKTVSMLSPMGDDEVHDVWGKAQVLDHEPDVQKSPEPHAQFSSFPRALCDARKYKTWHKDLQGFLYRQQTLTIWKCPKLQTISEPGEAQDDFRIRLSQLAKERRDLAIDKLRDRYGSKLARLQDRIRTAQQRVDREKSQYRSHQFQSAVSVGASLLGALVGRKLASRTNVSRAGTAIRSAGRTAQQHADIELAQKDVDALQQQLADVEAEFAEQVKAIQHTEWADEMTLEAIEVRPRKSDIQIEKCALAWTPWQVDDSGMAEPLF